MSALASLSWTLGFGAWLGVLAAVAYYTLDLPRHDIVVRAVLLTSPLLGSIVFGAAFLSVSVYLQFCTSTLVHMFRLDVLTSLVCFLLIGGIVLGVWVQVVDMSHAKTPAQSAEESPAPSSADTSIASDSEQEQERGQEHAHEDVGSDSGIVADDEVGSSGDAQTDRASATTHTSDQFDTISADASDE